MKLLFDNNLSPRLPQRLADVFPGAMHVAELGFERAGDVEVLEYASTSDCIIVTKDSDFNDLLLLQGLSARVVWIRIGNCTTAQIETVLRSNQTRIAELAARESGGLLSLLSG